MLRIVQEAVIDGVTQEYASIEVSPAMIVLFVTLIAAFYITFYVLRSIGVYKLARRQGVAHAYFAWIPCLWMFTAYKIIGNTKLFGSTMEKLAIWACIIFSVASILPIVHDFFGYFPYIMYYLQGGSIDLVVNGSVLIRPVETAGISFNNLFDTPAINTIIKILYAVDYVLSIVNIFVTVFMYINLFKKFWPEHYILAAVFSFFGLFSIFVFAIRDRKEVDFNEYIRRRYYGAGYTPYGGNGYGQNDGQGRTFYGDRQTPYSDNTSGGGKDEPFGEFSNRPGEPFSEFSDDKNSYDGKDNDNDDKF